MSTTQKALESAKENIKHIRTDLEALGADEALEFLESLEDDLISIDDSIRAKDESIAELESNLNEAEEETELSHEFTGIETIRWSAPNLMDTQVMEALQEAYTKLNPAQIIRRLKV